MWETTRWSIVIYLPLVLKTKLYCMLLLLSLTQTDCNHQKTSEFYSDVIAWLGHVCPLCFVSELGSVGWRSLLSSAVQRSYGVLVAALSLGWVCGLREPFFSGLFWEDSMEPSASLSWDVTGYFELWTFNNHFDGAHLCCTFLLP